MNKDDVVQFSNIWSAACEVCGQTPTDAAIALSFQVLAKYDITDIQKALSTHLETSKFIPKPADIIEILNKYDGRPDADEAWSIAMESFDEYKTVILNDEIASSLEHARGIYNDGDKTGARMAFKASYEKAIASARRNGDHVKWWPSFGYDLGARIGPVEDAIRIGILDIRALDHVAHGIPQHEPEMLEYINKSIKRLQDDNNTTHLTD